MTAVEGAVAAGDPIPAGSTHTHRDADRVWCMAPGRAQASNPDGWPKVGASVLCSRTVGHHGQHEAAGVATILAAWGAP